MKMPVLAWESVTKETIINSFSKASISEDQQKAAVNYDDDTLMMTLSKHS